MPLVSWRRVTTAVAFALPLAAGVPAHAQHWNESGPGRDLLSSTIADLDAFRQRAPAQPAPGSAAAALPQQAARAPIPILDWVQPQAQPAPPPQQARRAAPRRTTPRREPTETVSAPRTTQGNDWERTFAERERELERLRRILEEDRQRFERSRQPQLQ